MNKTIRASDGLDYENITQRLLGIPAENDRNKEILSVRRFYPENEAWAFTEAYDKARGAHPDRTHAGWRAIDKARAATRDFGVIFIDAHVLAKSR